MSESERESSKRADRADVRATSADVRASAADVRATGADVRATAADRRADHCEEDAEDRLLATLVPLENKLDRTIAARNRTIAGLLALMLLMAGVGYLDLHDDRRNVARVERETKAREEALRWESIARAIANCQAINDGRATVAGLLDALLTEAAKRDASLPAAERRRLEEGRAAARRLAAERLAPEDCSTRANPPLPP